MATVNELLAHSRPEPSNRRKLSVLLVSHSYPPVIGGSEIEAQRVCSGLIKRGYRMEVVCCGGGPMPKESRWIDECGVPVRMFGTGDRGRLRDHVYALGAAWTVLTEGRSFDVIYFLMPGLQVLYGVSLARLLGIPSVMKFSGSNDLSDALRYKTGKYQVAAIAKWCARTMILNDAMVEEAANAGIERSRLVWMPNPVDTERYRPATQDERKRSRLQLGIPQDVPVVVFIGRLAPEKELPSLIDAFAKVVREHETARLIVAGDGVMRQELEAQVRQLGIEHRVTFPGMQNSEQICTWLQVSDVFTLVSRREGLPISLIEAMSVGLPAVVTDLAANTQLLTDGVHGLTARVRDSDGIAEALLRLLRDPELRARFGAAARPVVIDRFSVKTVLDHYEQMFNEIIERG